jgi:cytochrome c
MAAHPSLPASDIQQMVQWIMSLSDNKAIKKSLPAGGSLSPSLGKPVKDNGVLSISASYTDNGGVNIKSLTGRTVRLLRNNKVLFTGKEKSQGYTAINFGGINFLIMPAPAGWFALDNIDLSGIGSVAITAGWQQPPQYGFDFELRLDGNDGKLLGAGSLMAPKAQTNSGQIGFGMVKIPIEAVTDAKLHTIYVVSKTKDPKENAQVGIQSLQFNLK